MYRTPLAIAGEDKILLKPVTVVQAILWVATSIE